MAFTIAIINRFYIKLFFYLVHQVYHSANASRVTSYNVLLPVQKPNKFEDGYAVTRLQDTGLLCFLDHINMYIRRSYWLHVGFANLISRSSLR